MIVVSNASPLIGLAKLDHLELLHSLYNTVIIPPIVAREITTGKGSDRERLRTFPWLSVEPVQNTLALKALQSFLDEGEREVIVLAIEKNANLVLIDERLARIVALRNGLAVTGLIGVLLEAKERKLISALRPLIEELQQHGFRLKQTFIDRVLAESGE
jgi:predicted nucleic acid-binding protein